MQARIAALRVVRGGRVVLDVDALELPSGSTTAVFGPNGSGKTTLLRALAGLEPAARGTIEFGESGALSDRASVGLAFQRPVFLRGSVRANLGLGLELRDVPASERATRIAEVARECGVAHLLERNARELSAGEAQRVNLARALALRAPLTLLDEPLAGLDHGTRTALLFDLPRLLGTFATTTVVVTHDREEAFRLAERLVVLVGGQVRTAGAKADVYRRPPDAETATLLGYSVLPTPHGEVAVPPGGLRVGCGTPGWTLRIERVADLGNHEHLLGTIAGRAVDLRLPRGATAPTAGTDVEVNAAECVALRASGGN